MIRRLSEPPPELNPRRTKPPVFVVLEVVTPMAGHTATKAVPPTAASHAREASVANAVRNWWRLCHAAGHPTAETLFAAEEQRFGAAGRKGKIQVRATTINPGTQIVIQDALRNGRTYRKWPATWPRYALFPWESVAQPRFTEKLRFSVAVAVPDEYREEVRMALAAWVHLGGLGQRTRRGLGSLKRIGGDVLPSLHQVLEIPSATGPALVTRLPERRSVIAAEGTSQDAYKSWRTSVGTMEEFRQGEGFARDARTPGNNHPGQTYFPEADSIRYWTGVHDHPIQIKSDGFPRADLGLPIIVEFKAPRGVAVPPKSQINISGTPPGRSRFASPAITKAWWDEATEQFRPLVAMLSAPHVWEGGDVTVNTVTSSRHPEKGVSQTDIELNPEFRYDIWMSHLPIRDAYLARCMTEHGFRQLAAR